MENENKQLESKSEIEVFGHNNQDRLDLAISLPALEAATKVDEQIEELPASIHENIEEPKLTLESAKLSDIRLEYDSTKPNIETIKVISDENIIQKSKNETSQIHRKDTSETVALEVKPSDGDSNIPQALRTRFIRKVLFILLSQLVLSSLMVGMVFIPDNRYKNGVQNYPVIALITTIISIFSLMFLVCKRKNLKKVPWNYILLFIFTGSISYSLSFLASFTESTIVLIAALFTLVIVVGATIFAWRSKDNFSKLGHFLSQVIPLALVLLIAGLAFPGQIVQAAISAAIALIFSMYLTYDIYRLIGRFEDKYTLDDYILAALDIYIDIYMVFLELLKLLQSLVQN